jgi:hypothetical protein
MLLAWAACLGAAGCGDSTAPLSDPAAAKVDQRLLGVWRIKAEDGSVTYCHVGQAGEKLPGAMRIATVTHREDRIEPPTLLLAFVSRLGDKTYLNVADGKPERAERVAAEGWKTVDAYFILRYEMADDKLTIWTMDAGAKRQAVEGGKIKGTTERRQALLTDTTENLARFVAAAGDGLFRPEPARLERLEPARRVP